MRAINIITLSCLAMLSLLLSGCACVDPLEPLNRKIFVFNMALDKAIFRPVATAYDRVVPAPVACSIGNFFDNIDDVTNIANNVLQFKFYDAWSDAWRVGFNTTFGLLGLFDVASRAGLPKHHQDFGLTLARYGFVNSTYLMVPFFGPSTIRDTAGWFVDWNYLSVWPYIHPKEARYGLYGLRLVHKRACLLPADKLIDDALDPYVFVRDAYLQKRDADIRCICPPDPNPPETHESVDKDDTFIPDGETNKDSADPFVSDEGGEDTSSKKSSVGSETNPKAQTETKKQATSSPSADPFVEP
jgi:phospholipid-binding lipoprotein MlaA